jgi:hypothetical protein
MTTLQAVFTDEGLTESQDAKINGRYIKVTTFGCSEILGVYNPSRNFENISPMWVNLPISSSANISVYQQQLTFTIPPNVVNPNGTQNTSNKNISELYIFAETDGGTFTIDTVSSELIINSTFYNGLETGKPIRMQTTGSLPGGSPVNLAPNKTFYAVKTGSNRIKLARTKADAIASSPLTIIISGSGTGIHSIGKYFLLAFGQFTPDPLIWLTSSTVRLRTQLTLTNLNIADTFKFIYTQATEINDHNLDPNAHPFLQSAMEYGGIFPKIVNFLYNGQNLIRNANFHSSVSDKMLVYQKASDLKFYPALATTGEQTKYLGIAFLDDKTVRTGGNIQTNHTVPLNQDVYLSDVNLGELTSNVTPYKIGRSIGNGILSISASSGGGGGVNYLTDLIDVTINSSTLANKQTILFDATTGIWHNTRMVINDLSDVDTASVVPQNNNILSWDVNVWKPKALNLQDLNNVAIDTPLDTQVLKYNSSTSRWINSTLGIQIQSNLNINNITFGSGFTVTPSGTSASITYTGTGSSTFTGLSDVPDTYPTEAALVIVDPNLVGNKVKFLNALDSSYASPPYVAADEGYYQNGGVILLAVGKALFNFPGGDTDGIWSLSKSVTGGIIDGVGWFPPSVLVQGIGITGATTAKSAMKIIFGSNISGSLDNSTGILTINSANSSGGSFLNTIQTASGYFPAKSLVFNGNSSGVGRIRGIGAGNNVTIEAVDDNNNVVSTFSNSTWLRIKATMAVSNIAWSAGVVLARTSSDHSEIEALGIRAGANITITPEYSGSNVNYVIASSGTGGGGGGGFVPGSTYDLTSGQNGIRFNNGGNGIWLNANQNGIFATGCYYGAYIQNSIGAGLFIEQGAIGIDLRATIAAPLVFRPRNISQSQASAMPDGTIVYGNWTGSGSIWANGPVGLYFRIDNGSSKRLYKIQFDDGNVGATYAPL